MRKFIFSALLAVVLASRVALAAAGAELPEDPEAFRLWLHRARKQGLVTKFRTRRSKPPSREPIGD